MYFTAFRALVRKDLILYFSNRRGCLSSLLISVTVTLLFILLFRHAMG